MRTRDTHSWVMFAALLLNTSICQNLCAETCRIGIVADVHVRDNNRAQLRDWGQVKQWLEGFLDRMEVWKADFYIELGDLNDGHLANHALGDGHEDRINKGMAVWKTSMAAERSHKVPGYSVMGNHEVQNGRTHEAIAELKGMPGHYYSFDNKGYHFVVLDTNYSAGPHTKAFKIPADQVAWLKQDLAGSSNTTVVFLHVPIDTYFGVGGTRPDLQKEYNSVENEAEIRKILEDDGDVVLVVEGHAHSGPGPQANEPKETVTNGIRYWYVPSFNASVFCHAKLTLSENKCSIEFANDPEGVNAAGERGEVFKMPSYSFDLTAAQQRAFVQSKAHLPACGMNEERPSMWPEYR